MRPPVVSEKVEQQHIVYTLRLFRFQVYVVGHPSPNDGRKFRGTGQTAGIPDLFAFSPRRDIRLDEEERDDLCAPVRDFVWVECKRHGGQMSDGQREFQQLAREVGGRMHHVVGTLDAVIAWLIETRWAKPEQFTHYRQPKGISA